MTVALPTNPRAQKAKPRFIDFGSITEPSLGGEDQRLTRLGSRWSAEYQLPPLKGDDARIWIARLIRGRHEKARMYFPQPGVAVDPAASAAINGAHIANAFAITIKNLANVATIYEGQFIAIIKGGKRYIYQVTADRAGPGVMGIMPGLRTLLAGDEVVEIGTPYIEGFVSGPEEGWDIDAAKIYGLSFSIREAA